MYVMFVLDVFGFIVICYFVVGWFGGVNDWDVGVLIMCLLLMICEDMFVWCDYGYEIGLYMFDYVVLLYVLVFVLDF